MAATNRPCAYTNCLLQLTCAQRLLPASNLRHTTSLVTENPQENMTILDAITRHPARIRGTHVPLECGGDAYVLDSGDQVLELGARFRSIRHYATTVGPEPKLGITTEVLFLASHCMAPSDEKSFILKLIANENGMPVAASDDLHFTKEGTSEPWVLRKSEREIAMALAKLTPMLIAATDGIEKALTPELTGQASLSVHIDTSTSDPQTVTLDVQSVDREDGFRFTEDWFENLFTRRKIVRLLQSLGFVQD